MSVRPLVLEDKQVFDTYLRSRPHELSVYAFENIYIWKSLYKIYWEIIDNNLCVFFKDRQGCFLYLAPLAGKVSMQVVEEVFAIMDRLNRRKSVSRIENIEAADIALFRGENYECIEKPGEYLCDRQELVALRGNRFKSKRAAFNYFMKHYTFEYLSFSPEHKSACLKLYNGWMASRVLGNSDPVYQGMLKDSLKSLQVALDNFTTMDIAGRLVKIGGKVKAFTFGFRLNQDTFCVLYEITDLSIKGLSQFIFKKFCEECKGYRYINIMDDSGLDNLKKVKLSYQPVKLIPSYIVRRAG